MANLNRRMAYSSWLLGSCFLILAVALVGCATTHEASRAKFRRGDRNAYTAPTGGASAALQATHANASFKPPRDHYLLIKPKKDSKPGKETVAFVSIPYHLWAPFRVEITVGVFGGKISKLGDGWGCLELDERDSDPLVFYNLCFRDSQAGGLQVFSFNDGSGQQNFDISEVELAIEADGTDLIFEARPREGFLWAEIHRVPFDNQTMPLVPSVGTFMTDKGAKVGFDEFFVVSNGVDPNPLSPERAAVETIWQAAMNLIDAAYRMDGPPDFFNSRGLVSDGRDAIDAAIDQTKALAAGKPRDKALKQLKKAKKEAKKAFADVDSEKARKSSTHLEKTVSQLVSAVMALEPDFELPGS